MPTTSPSTFSLTAMGRQLAPVFAARAATSDSVLTGIDPTEFTTANPIRLFIIQASIIIIFSRVLAVGFRRLNQPTVIAEVIGGIILGPTVMGRIPGFSAHIFPVPSLPYLNLVATIGLVLFMFLVGLEVDLRLMRKSAKECATVSLVGIAVPLALGAALSKGIYDNFVDETKVTFGHFLLFTGVAMSITAFPILARILTEMKLLSTRVGVVVLAAGVGNDVVGWILLALTVALVNASSGVVAVYVLLCAVGWTLILFFLIKPLFVWLANRTGSFENGPNQLMITVTLILMLISAWITDIIGVHPIFGAFLVGIMVPHEGGFAVALTEKIEDLVSVVFLPLYFTLSGLKTNLGDLNSGLIWGYTIATIIVAFMSKFGGCAIAAKLMGFNLRESAAIGTLMSCKGLVELIVLNIGLSAGILNTQTFSMFVLMAVVTTVATTPLTLWIYPEKHRRALDDQDDNDVAKGSKSGSAGSGDSSDPEGARASSLGTKRLMVVLTSFEHLPGLMTFVRLMRPNVAAAFDDGHALSGSGDGLRQRNNRMTHSSTSSSSADEKGSGGDGDDDDKEDISDDAPVPLARGYPSTDTRSSAIRSPVHLDALRLVELTDRTSAVMRVAESDDTMRLDPISNVFRTFAQLQGIAVRTAMRVVSTDQFSSTVASRARNVASDLVLLPWTMPVLVGEQTSPQHQSSQQGLASTLASPFDGIFGRGGSTTQTLHNQSSALTTATSPTNATGDQQLTKVSSQHTALARKLIQSADCDVGLLVQRGAALSSAGMSAGRPHVLLAFMGGPDDRVALDFVGRLAATNDDLTCTVLRLQRCGEAEEGSEGEKLPTVPPTVHHAHSLSPSQAGGGNTIGGVQDTYYSRSHLGDNAGPHRSPLESLLEDDIALQRLERDPRLAAARDAGRLTVQTVSSARPLKAMIEVIQQKKPSLVVVGRGRKNPTLGSHRDELKTLLHYGWGANGKKEATAGEGDIAGAAAAAEADTITTASASSQPVLSLETTSRLVNGETCKVVGEPAFAIFNVLLTAKTNSGSNAAEALHIPLTLVVASGNNSSSTAAEGRISSAVNAQEEA